MTIEITEKRTSGKIYLFCEPGGLRPTDVMGYALAEDGTGLCSHMSSNKEFSKHDMGLTSDWHHGIYQKHYPDGFDLEWVDDLDNHPGFCSALKLNRAQSKGADDV